MAELETVKKSNRKASRSRSNADEKTRIKIVGENGVKDQQWGKSKHERKRRGNLSVSDKMSLLKVKVN